MAKTLDELLKQTKEYLTEDDFNFIQGKMSEEEEAFDEYNVSKNDKENFLNLYYKCWLLKKAMDNLVDSADKMEKEILPQLEKKFQNASNSQEAAKIAAKIQSTRKIIDEQDALRIEMKTQYEPLYAKNSAYVNKLVEEVKNNEVKKDPANTFAGGRRKIKN